jgi:hypothetical protein
MNNLNLLLLFGSPVAAGITWFLFSKGERMSGFHTALGVLLIPVAVFFFALYKLAPEKNEAPVVVKTPVVVAQPKPVVPGIGRSYEDVIANTGVWFGPMEYSVLASSEGRKMAKSIEGAALLEVIGDNPKEVTRADLTFFAVSDNAAANMANIGILGLFVHNVFPDWETGPKSVLDGLVKLAKNPQGSHESEMIYGGNRIELGFTKELGMFSIAVRNLDAAR